MITRRSVLLAGSIGLLVSHPLSRGQSAATIRRVGWVSLGSIASPAEAYAAFKQGMHDLGWLEGKNVAHQAAYANGDITGITTQSDATLGKLIGVLHELAPGARRIAILLNENNPNHTVFWAAAQKGCAALDLVALRLVATGPAQFGATTEQIVRQQSQAVVVVADPIFLNERVKLQELLQTTRLPVAYSWREHVVAGGLLSYAADLAASAHHVATYVDKILKGAKPADLPVEQPKKFELVINLKTAKALGLTIPQPLLLRADEVIQ